MVSLSNARMKLSGWCLICKPLPDIGWAELSHYMTALAMRQTKLKPAAKIVLYWLCDHYNEETEQCFPSLKTLARESEMGKSTVVRILDGLEKDGLIARVPRTRENGSQTSTAYSLSLTPVPKRDSPCPKMGQPPVPNRDTHNLGNINLGNEPEAKASERKPPRRAVQLPEGWVPSDRNIADAQAKGLSARDIENEADRFRDHHTARGTAFKDWDAGWRTWIGNAARYRSMAVQPAARGYGQGSSIASIVARRRLEGEV